MKKNVSQKKLTKSDYFKWGGIALGVVLVLGVLLFILEKKDIINLVGNKNPTSQGPTKKQAEEAAKAAANSKQTYLDQTYKDGTTTSQPTNTTPTPATPSSSPSSMTLTAKIDGKYVTVTTQIQNISSGTCELTASNGANSIPPQPPVQIIYQPEFSSCAGFSILKSSLGSGTWNISVTASPSAGEATTQSTTLEVN